jgi:small-conductance mechanosensitive channel
MKSNLFSGLAVTVGAALTVAIIPSATGLDATGQAIHNLAGTIVPLLGLFAAVSLFGVLLTFLSFDSGGM